MNPLIETIHAHCTPALSDLGRKLCSELIAYIEKYGIQTEEELEKREDAYFTLADPAGPEKRLPDGEIINSLCRDIQTGLSYPDPDADPEDVIPDALRDWAFEELEHIGHDVTADEKYLRLIRIFAALDWDMTLPHKFYSLLISGRL